MLEQAIDPDHGLQPGFDVEIRALLGDHLFQYFFDIHSLSLAL